MQHLQKRAWEYIFKKEQQRAQSRKPKTIKWARPCLFPPLETQKGLQWLKQRTEQRLTLAATLGRSAVCSPSPWHQHHRAFSWLKPLTGLFRNRFNYLSSVYYENAAFVTRGTETESNECNTQTPGLEQVSEAAADIRTVGTFELHTRSVEFLW